MERFFFLDDTDRELIARYRGEHNRLGFALQLGTVRYLGTFLSDPVDVPWAAIEYTASQLDVADPSVVKRYTERAAAQWEHAAEIRKSYGYREFSGTEVVQQFRQFMAGRAWTHTEGPYQLFDQATAWLRQHRVLLPGASVLARQVAAVRAEAADRVHRTIADAVAAADPGLPSRLAGLLEVADGQRSSSLDRLRRPPRRRSGRAMVMALDRVAEVLAIGAGRALTEPVPTNRLEMLARYGLAAKAPALRSLAEPRRTATLLATARHLEAAAVDDALDLFDVLMATRLISEARRASAAERTAALPRLERASATLASAWRALQAVLEAAEDGMVNVPAAWAAIEKVASRDQVRAAAAVVEELVPDEGSEDAAMRESLAAKYGVVRPFLELLAEKLPLEAVPAGQELLAEVRRLPALARRRVNARRLRHDEVDADSVPGAWQRAVYHNRDLPPEAVDRDAYVLCILEQLHRKLRVRDIFAQPSVRWADPRARLLAGAEWQALRGEVLAGLGLDQPVEAHLAEAAAALDAAWQLLARRLEEAGPDASVRVLPDGDRVKLSVERLEGVGEPASLAELRGTVAAMLPRVDLPDLLLEVHAWTGFLNEHTHIGGLATRIDDLPVSIAALLVAEACNVGLAPVVKPSVPALTRDRLSHVDQNYLRAETHSAANARLIEAQARVRIAQLWGGGLVASADGLRFVVPVQTINAAPSPKYFGYRRGITWLNAINDQMAGIGAVVVPGTVRDSLYILDAMLNLDAGPKPEMIATDTASYSDIVFGLFRLLGYRFAPRIADLPDQRYWRATPPGAPEGDYGPLNAIACNRVNLAKIQGRWEEMLQVAGSLVTGRARAYDLVRMLGSEGRPTPLGQAFAEYGRIAKTLHLLALVDPVDETYRRTVHRQLTIQESRHQLGRRIYHGQRGEMRQPYREGQEDQLGALGLVLNAVVLWNTRYTDVAVNWLREHGLEVRDEDAARLSPLGFHHVNFYGRYTFALPASAELRPLGYPGQPGSQ